MIQANAIHLMIRLIAVIMVCALPSAAAVQTWADAYRAGQYERAAELLHAIVVVADPMQAMVSDNPEPFHHLALLYSKGLGVTRDPVAACTLAHMEYGAWQNAAPRYAKDLAGGPQWAAKVSESERFINEICRGLSDSERLAAISAHGCYAFGMPEQVLTVGDQSIRVGRRGVRPADEPDNAMYGQGCPILFAGVRVTTVEPPTDAAQGVKARLFVELFTWRMQLPSDGSPQYLLEWRPHEVLKNDVVPSGEEVVKTDRTWPRPAAPPDLERLVSLEMIRSGHVRWRIAGAQPKRGWI